MKPFYSLLNTAVAVSLLTSTSLYADRGHDRGGYDRGGYNRGGYRDFSPRIHNDYRPRHNAANWVVPLVVGGVLGYALSEPRRTTMTYVSTPAAPVYASPAPVYSTAGYGVSYGSQPVYEERWVYFSDCDCERKVLVQIR